MSTQTGGSLTANSPPNTELWAPCGPDVYRMDMSRDNESREVLAIGGSGYVYKYKGLAYKLNCTQRELNMMQKAGDCAAPLDIKSVKEHEKVAIKDDIIQLISTLHKKYQMVHGDIKPLNMLRCSDGKLRLCDFDTARPIDEAPEAWDGLCTDQYLAPNRDFFQTGAPPTPSDDIYALGLSIWELYTGKQALIEELDNIEEVLKERRTVDLTEVEDQDVRELIKGFLRQGGALV